MSDRKTSLAARLERFGTLSSQLPSSQGGADEGAAELGGAATQQNADAAAPPPEPASSQQPTTKRRKLPAWLTATEQPTPAAAAAPEQQANKPKVSIKARVAAAMSQLPEGLSMMPLSDTLPTQAGVPDTAAAAAAAAGQRPSLAARLENPRLHSRFRAAANAGAIAGTAAATAEAGNTANAAAPGADPAGAGETAAAAFQTQAEPPAQEQPPPQEQEQEQEQEQADTAQANPLAAQPVSPGMQPGAASLLWDSEDEGEQQHEQQEDDNAAARHRQQQQEQQQQREEDQQQQQQEVVVDERELTLQQRQRRQMEQLGLKWPGGGDGAGAAGEDAWLKEALGGAGKPGRSGGGGSRRHSKKADAAAAGGSGGGGRSGPRSAGGGAGGARSGGGGAGASGGSSRARGSGSGGGRARSAAASPPAPAAAAAGGGGGGDAAVGGTSSVPPAATTAAAAAAAPPQQQQQAGAGSMQLANALQEYAEADDAAAGDEGGDGSGPEPLVLYDEEANLRLQVPGSLNQHLRSYQRQGVEFLFSRYAAGNGGVCCDDMGLGKTVQAISFIAALLGKQGTPQDALPRSFAAFRRERQLQRQQRRQIQDDGEDFEDDDVEAAGSTIRWPILVVCPTSVLDNWVRELNMWGTFKVVKYHGPPAVRQGIADEASSGQYEVILTSYDTLRVDAPAIAEMHPHAVIFDEAHKLKNDKSKQYEAAASLPTKFRYGLSGTIMQNNWDELYAVLDLLCPYCLGEYGGFVEYYSRPIKRGQSSTATNYEVVKAEKRRRQLVEVVKQVALRRTKAIIADQLPRKTDNVVFCQLQPLQYRAYDRTLASPDLQALRMARSLCDCGSGNKSAKCCHEMVPESEGGVLWPHYHCCDCDVETCKRHRPLGCADYYESMGYSNPRLRCPYCLMLPAISLLTKISNHLELIRPDAKLEELDKRQFDFELAVADMVLGPDADVLGGLVANSSGWLGASDETHCGKMATLKMLLEAWSGDYSSHNKVLLFSHSTRCLDLLEAFVQRQGYDYLRLDGSTPQKNRQGICDEFNTRPSIFLLLMSTVAGGLGLNLTAANKVVVFDPSWNPAHDLQAQDRAYRLGQTRDVAVYRLVGTGTLEEAVYRRQIYKQQQANMIVDAQQEPRYWEGVQGETDKPGELWGLWNLLRFSGQTVETRDILQAYQGRRRQRIEQQLQDDAQRQQQEQQPGQGGQQQQQQPAVPSGGGGGDEAAAGPTAVPSGPAAAAAAPAKPFKIIVLDQLVGPSDEDEGLEGVLYADEAAAGGAHRRKGKHAAAAGKRASSDAGDAEEGAAGAAAAAGGGGRGGGGNDVGGMAAAEEAWCDEAVLEGLLDDLMSDEDDDEDATDASKQQHKRQRRRAVLSDSDAEEGEDAAAAAAAVTAGGGLSPVAEGDELGGGADSQEGPAGSDAEYVYGSQGSGGLSADAGSDGDVGDAADAADVDDETLAPVVAVDPVLAALEEQGAILHVHRHEKVLGTAGSRKAKAAQQSQQQLSQQQPPSQQQSPSQQQPHRQRSGRRHLASQQQQTQQQLSSVDSLRRGPVSEAFMRCSPAVAAAAGAAGSQGWGPLASLAVYQGVSVVEMAQWLVALTPEERKQVLAMYAADMS